MGRPFMDILAELAGGAAPDAGPHVAAPSTFGADNLPEDHYPREEIAPATLDALTLGRIIVPTMPRHVVPRAADYWRADSQALAVGAITMLLTRDENRRRAVLVVTSTTGQLVIGPDRNSVESGAGYVLDTADPPLELFNKWDVYAKALSAVTVSVISESDFEGEKEHMEEPAAAQHHARREPW